jgi:anti-sigma regulatory factor (Ser/Thr protein kinase)
VDNHEPDSGAGPAIQGWPLVSWLPLAALPTAVSCGRLHTQHVLREWRLKYMADEAQMLVSELLTNAVKASWSPQGAGLIDLRLLANYERLLIEVWDRNPDDPMPRRPDAEAESGRGFMVIEAMAHAWGYQRINPGLKVVWCKLLTSTNHAGT